MRKRYLGIICLLYSGIIAYVWGFYKLKNFLAPQMQIYIKLSLVPMLIIGLILCFIKDKEKSKFKISDLVLFLPILMLILAGDGRLSTTLSSNRVTNYNNTKKASNIIEKEENMQEIIQDQIEENYDFSNIDFDIIDDNYLDTATYFTYAIIKEKMDDYVGKTIRVRGFISNIDNSLSKEYFNIGKYAISCCAADAAYVNFYAKYNSNEFKNNAWYEIEGVFQKGKNKSGKNIMYINVINAKEISSLDEEQYIYPCYSYGDGTCSEFTKYNLY